MAKRSLIDQLNDAVEVLIAQPGSPLPASDPRLESLLAVAGGLRDFPREDFKLRLKADLERKVSMTATPQQTPKSYQAATPYLAIKDAAGALDFYKRAFGAIETMRLADPSGRIGHAEIQIGRASIMLAEEHPEIGFLSPESLGGSAVTIHLYVDDVDALAERAVEAGAKLMRPVQDQFYGDRAGQLADPYGHVWFVATHKEDVPAAELEKRFEALMQQGGGDAAPEQRQSRPVQPIREGFHTVTPYLTVRRAAELVEFVKEAFGATELMRGTGSMGGLHAEVKIGDSIVMMGGYEQLEHESPAMIYLYVPDVDATHERAVKAGGRSYQPPTNQPYGDRTAHVRDPFGNDWYIATHIEDVQLS
jgi:PhnB protein